MKITKPSIFILDVDGVLTNGQFIYTAEGKFAKIFGPDDNDALKLLEPYLEILFVTGDRKGFEISKRRIVTDMGYKLELVSTIRRKEWIKEKFPLKNVIYMGDGIFFFFFMKHVGYAIAPSNADTLAKEHAHYVTHRAGGERAVAEACLHILDTFFESFNTDTAPKSESLSFGEWSA